MPGGIAIDPGYETIRPREVFIEKSKADLTDRDRQRIGSNDEALIRELVLQGFKSEDFDKAIDPKLPVARKKEIAKTVANNISAVFKTMSSAANQERRRRGRKSEFT